MLGQGICNGLCRHTWVHNGSIVGAHCTVVRTGMTGVCSRLELMVEECDFLDGGGGGGL